MASLRPYGSFLESRTSAASKDLLNLFDPHHPGPLEGRIINGVLPHHRAGERRGGFPDPGIPSRFQDDDRLAHGIGPCRTHEFSCTADVLHIKENAPRLVVPGQEIDEISEIDVNHRSKRGKHAETNMFIHRPVEYCRGQRTALGYEGDMTGQRVCPRTPDVEARLRPDKTKGIGPQNAQIMFLPCRPYPLLAALARHIREDDGTRGAGFTAFLDEPGHFIGRGCNNGKIDVTRDVCDPPEAGKSQPCFPGRVYGEQGPLLFLEEVPEHHLATTGRLVVTDDDG